VHSDADLYAGLFTLNIRTFCEARLLFSWDRFQNITFAITMFMKLCAMYQTEMWHTQIASL